MDGMCTAFVCCLQFMQMTFLPSLKLKLDAPRWQIPEGLNRLFYLSGRVQINIHICTTNECKYIRYTHKHTYLHMWARPTTEIAFRISPQTLNASFYMFLHSLGVIKLASLC